MDTGLHSATTGSPGETKHRLISVTTHKSLWMKGIFFRTLCEAPKFCGGRCGGRPGRVRGGCRDHHQSMVSLASSSGDQSVSVTDLWPAAVWCAAVAARPHHLPAPRRIRQPHWLTRHSDIGKQQWSGMGKINVLQQRFNPTFSPCWPTVQG